MKQTRGLLIAKDCPILKSKAELLKVVEQLPDDVEIISMYSYPDGDMRIGFVTALLPDDQFTFMVEQSTSYRVVSVRSPYAPKG